MKRERKVEHQERVVLSAGEIILMPGIKVGWSCLHQNHREAEGIQSRIIVLRRHTSSQEVEERTIPSALHEKLVRSLEISLPKYDVTICFGNDSFCEARSMFGEAVAVLREPDLSSWYSVP